VSDRSAGNSGARADAAVAKAVEAIRAGGIQDAISILEAALDRDPESVRLNFELGNIRYQTLDVDGALVNFQRAFDLDPAFMPAGVNIGGIHFARQDWAAAELIFQQMLDHNPADAKALNYLGNISFEVGDFEQALARYQKAGEIAPDWWEPVHNKATALSALDRAAEALGCHDLALRMAPGEVEAVIAAAAAYLDGGDASRALEIVTAFRDDGGRVLDTELLFWRGLVSLKDFEAALRHYQALDAEVPSNAQVLLDLACGHVAAGNYDNAVEAYKRAAAAGADGAQVNSAIGEVLALTGEPTAALEYLAAAHRLAPENIQYVRNIALAYLQAGKDDEAIEWFQRAVDLAPGNVAAILEIARVYLSRHRSKEAVPLMTQVLRDHPDVADAHHVMGLALHFTHREDEALASCRRALELDPGLVDVYATIADIYKAEKLWQESLKAVQQGLEIEPENPKLLKTAFSLNRSFHQIKEALKVGGRYLALQPDSIEVLADMVDTVLTACQWTNLDQFVSELVRAVDKRILNHKPIGICVNNLQALPLSHEYIVNAAANASMHILKDTAIERAKTDFDLSPARYAKPGAKAGKIRIGYLLPYVRFHSMPMAVKETVIRHDRDVFEVFGYSVSYPEKTDYADGFISVFDEFSWVERRAALAQKIHDDEISILIDCSGHTPKTCLDVCALRPAPINLHFLGCNMSTGADIMDYVLSDRISIPPSEADLGGDKMLYMPHTFMPAIRSEISDDCSSRELEGLPDDAVVFCNFNQPFKIEPRIFQTWMEIMRGVPNSVFWLGEWNDAATQNLRGYAEGQGVDPARLVFGSVINHDKHLARLQHASLSLDTYYHGGGITTVDCLRVGLPVLCIQGDTPSSRLGASILQAHGMPDLVLEDFEAYRKLAIELALDADRLAEVRAKCSQNLENAPLFDFEKYVRDLECGLKEIHKAYIGGRLPQHTYIGGIASELR